MGGLHSWAFSCFLFLASSSCLGCFSSIGWYWSAAARQPLGESRIDRSGWSTKRSLRSSWAQARGFTGGGKLHPAKYAATGCGTKQTRTCRDCGRNGLGAPQDVGSSGVASAREMHPVLLDQCNPPREEKKRSWLSLGCPFGRRGHGEGLYGMGKSYTVGGMIVLQERCFQSAPNICGMPGGAKAQCLGFCRPVWCLCFPRKFLKVQCLESGQWEEGHCVPVVCKPPPPVFEGMYNCTQGFELDSQCVLNCEQQGQQVSGWGEAHMDHTSCFRASTKCRAPCALLCRGALQQFDLSPRPNTL